MWMGEVLQLCSHPAQQLRTNELNARCGGMWLEYLFDLVPMYLEATSLRLVTARHVHRVPEGKDVTDWDPPLANRLSNSIPRKRQSPGSCTRATKTPPKAL